MKLRLLTLLVVGLLGMCGAYAQAQQFDAVQVQQFVAQNPQHRAAFTEVGAEKGMMVCTDKAAFLAYNNFMEQQEAATPAATPQLIMTGEQPQTFQAGGDRTEKTGSGGRTELGAVKKRITELEGLMKQDPSNSEYTREYKQLISDQQTINRAGR